MRLIQLLSASFAVLAIASSSSARASACDEEPYDVDELLAQLLALEKAIIDQHDEVAAVLAASMQRRLPCLDGWVPGALFERLSHAMGAGHHLGADERNAGLWARIAAEAGRETPFREDELSPEHPLWALHASWRALPVDEPETLDGLVFKDEFYLNGRRASLPSARPGRYNLLQRKEGGRYQTWLIVGASFPESVLVPAPEPTAEARKWWRRRPRMGGCIVTLESE